MDILLQHTLLNGEVYLFQSLWVQKYISFYWHLPNCHLSYLANHHFDASSIDQPKLKCLTIMCTAIADSCQEVLHESIFTWVNLHSFQKLFRHYMKNDSHSGSSSNRTFIFKGQKQQFDNLIWIYLFLTSEKGHSSQSQTEQHPPFSIHRPFLFTSLHKSKG